MKVLVTGAAGQLGAYVVRRLVRQGQEVRGLVEPGRDAGVLGGTGVECFDGDVLDAAAVRQAVSGCQGVIHAAAIVSFWPARSRRTRRVNLEGTLNLVEASLEAGVRRFVYVGSASSFGPGTRGEPADETSPYRNARYRLSYMDSKRLAQEAVLDAAARRGLPAVVVNPTYMIGAFGSRHGSSGILLKLPELKAVPPGGRNFVYVGDAATGVCNALERGRIGECYILGHANLSYLDAARLFSKVARVAAPAGTARQLAVQLLGLAGSLMAAFTRRPPALSFPVARMLCRECYYSPRKAVRELGLPQTPLDRAARDAIAWLAREGCSWPRERAVQCR